MDAAYFFRVVPIFSFDELPNPYECFHDWRRTDTGAGTTLTDGGDAYCPKCKHRGILSEDTRNRAPEWWREQRARAQAARGRLAAPEIRELE